jgi:hypothetical protein
MAERMGPLRLVVVGMACLALAGLAGCSAEGRVTAESHAIDARLVALSPQAAEQRRAVHEALVMAFADARGRHPADWWTLGHRSLATFRTTAVAFARFGDAGNALAAAGLEDDELRPGDARRAVVEVLAQSGYLAAAADAATALGKDAHEDVWEALGIAQAQAGLFSEASQTADRMRPGYRARVFAAMARAAHDRGDGMAAGQWLEKARADTDYPLLIGRTQLYLGDAAGARKSAEAEAREAEGFGDLGTRIRALGLAAGLLEDAGDARRARAVLREAAEAAAGGGPAARRELARVAVTQSKLGFVDDGLATAERLSPAKPNAPATPGSSDAASGSADGGGPTDWGALRDRYLTEARVCAAAGRWDDVLAACRRALRLSIFDPETQDLLLDKVKHDLASGDDTAARATVAWMPTDCRRVEGLLTIALAQAVRGDKSAAVATADMTTPIAGRAVLMPVFERVLSDGRPLLIAPFNWRDPATWDRWGWGYEFFFSDLHITALPENGRLGETAIRLAVALGVQKDWDLERAFRDFEPLAMRRIARAQAEAGDVEGALEWARQMPLPDGRLQALAGIVEAITGGPFPEQE